MANALDCLRVVNMKTRIMVLIGAALFAGCAVDRKVSLSCKGECKYVGHGVMEVADPTAADERPAPRIVVTPNRLEVP
jgi:hypothetical protein